MGQFHKLAFGPSAIVLAVVSVGQFGLEAQPQATGRFRFVDVTAEAGLDIPLAPGGPGLGIGDYNGDGWQDISISGGEDPRPMILRHTGNFEGPGTWFENVSDQILPEDRIPASLSMFADLDNDGDHDLLTVRRYQNVMGDWDTKHTGLMHYENVDGQFVASSTEYDLGKVKKRNGGLALADLDGDGDLDAAFTHSAPAGLTSGSPGFFVRNEGNLQLVDATAEIGPDLGEPRRYFSVLLADFTGNGRIDLHSSVDAGMDFHCHPNEQGTYSNVAFEVGATNFGSDMGLAVGDIENDGDLDIFSTNIDLGVLYVNDGAGNFTNEATARGVGIWPGMSIGWGTAFVDLDLDGDQDLVFVGNGDPGFVYINDGKGFFTRIPGAVAGMNLIGHGLIPFDFDHDGDQDLLVWRSDAEPARLYENQSPIAHRRRWLSMNLRGTSSNRDGVGARIVVTAGEETQTRTIYAGYSFKSGPPMNAHFGLGSRKVIDRIEIQWPSGTTQVLTGVSTNQRLRVVEPR